ncbi:hypothetical protein ACFO25_10030 [Paenactinomyces guangxiensis]|uniref:Uncharacterized protein n=1 Tax=Paenactinomyces guangxiensis TaxID=1490290 RepID=A0A7W2A9Q3_9BACL|nr:hypothetical protein [Paenactinomyces guangxiensis]MBA4495123.1 hypothetical protein [Paenactinomyces guangxiensis]MBH8592193.1 hypothetical protein [Paenactinomyces guangxiensis]
MIAKGTRLVAIFHTLEFSEEELSIIRWALRKVAVDSELFYSINEYCGEHGIEHGIKFYESEGKDE